MGQAEQPLRSQQLRKVNHQGDALRLGMNWTEEISPNRRCSWKARTGWVTLARFTSAA
jgi:hypothetical protein